MNKKILQTLKEFYGYKDKNEGIGTGIFTSFILFIISYILNKPELMLLLIPCSFFYFTIQFMPFWNLIKNE